MNPTLTAGQQLKSVRKSLGYRIEDVVRRAQDEFGEACRVNESGVSKLENGRLMHAPGLETIAQLGYVYKMSPTEMYRLFGLPAVGSDTPALNHELRRAAELNAKLPDNSPEKAALMMWIQYGVTQAQAMMSTGAV